MRDIARRFAARSSGASGADLEGQDEEDRKKIMAVGEEENRPPVPVVPEESEAEDE